TAITFFSVTGLESAAQVTPPKIRSACKRTGTWKSLPLNTVPSMLKFCTTAVESASKLEYDRLELVAPPMFTQLPSPAWRCHCSVVAEGALPVRLTDSVAPSLAFCVIAACNGRNTVTFCCALVEQL